MCASHFKSCEHGRAVPITFHVTALGGEEISNSHLCPRQVVTGPEVKRAWELSLLLISGSTQESGHYTFPGQHNRVGPKGVDVGGTTLRTWKMENRPCPLHMAGRGELARLMLESSPMVKKGRADGLANLAITQVQYQVKYWPNPTSVPWVICWSMGRQWAPVLPTQVCISPWHMATMGCPGRVSARIQCQWCSRDQGLQTKSMILCDECDKGTYCENSLCYTAASMIRFFFYSFFFLLSLILFYRVGEVAGAECGCKVMGVGWDCDTWCERHKGLKKVKKIWTRANEMAQW